MQSGPLYLSLVSDCLSELECEITFLPSFLKKMAEGPVILLFILNHQWGGFEECVVDKLSYD